MDSRDEEKLVTDKPAKGAKDSQHNACMIELEALAVNVDKVESDLGAPSSLPLSSCSSEDTLKEKKRPVGCWARYRQRVRESRKWKIGTCLVLTLIVGLIVAAIMIPVVYYAIIPAVANSTVSSTKLTIDTVQLGQEDLARGALATSIRGKITGMPGFEVDIGETQAKLSTADGTQFATMRLSPLHGKGTIMLQLDSEMLMTNRTAFDTLARTMIRGQPGVVHMRAEHMPVKAKLGPFWINVYRGVTIDMRTEFAGLSGLNNVNVSDNVVLVGATPDSLTIAMDVALANPSTTVATAQDGIVLNLLSADTNETLGRVRLSPFTLQMGAMTPVKALTDIIYTNTTSAEVVTDMRRGVGVRSADNTEAVRRFLSNYMSGKDVALRLVGPDTTHWKNATYVQRALVNWTTDIALAAQSSASFVTGTRVTAFKPFEKIGQAVLDAEVTATNPFDLPVTVRNVSIVISMNKEEVGVIGYTDNGVIPPKGNITLTGLETTIDIGHFIGQIFNDIGDWLNSVFTGKGTIMVGNVDLRGHIEVGLNDAFPVFLPILSLDVPLDQLTTNSSALMPAGR